MPLTLGTGERLFDGVGGIQLEPLVVRGTLMVTHLRYRVLCSADAAWELEGPAHRRCSVDRLGVPGWSRRLSVLPGGSRRPVGGPPRAAELEGVRT